MDIHQHKKELVVTGGTDGLLIEVSLILSTMSFLRITPPHITQDVGPSIVIVSSIFQACLIPSSVEPGTSFLALIPIAASIDVSSEMVTGIDTVEVSIVTLEDD